MTTYWQSTGIGNVTCGKVSGETFTAIDANSAAPSVISYISGAEILTGHGEVPIESLKVGDLVATRFGGLRPIKSIGRKRFNSRFAAQHIAPVCIHTGALGPDVPRRDLYVSPTYAILIDEHLVQASLLVNDITITQEWTADYIEYLQIDLDEYDCVLAENAWGKSYCQEWKRNNLLNADTSIHVGCVQETWLPLVNRETDPRIHTLRKKVTPAIPADCLTEDGDLHLVADGLRLEPQRIDQFTWRFSIPAGVRSLRLRSRTARPSMILGELDHRRLGFCVTSLVAKSGDNEIPVPLDHVALGRGFHNVERDNQQMWRWTNSDALLPVTLLGGSRTPITLTIMGRHLPQSLVNRDSDAIKAFDQSNLLDCSGGGTATRAESLALEDALAAVESTVRRFSTGSRPVIRWIKGDGHDDAVTRAAIGHATRLFGSEVDYCLCTHGINASRARAILEWAGQPVEWWPVTERDNPQLARVLAEADCPPSHFGYWWKWFPERVRVDAPEWILDGDMVITSKPSWFDQWAEGTDCVRMTQDDVASPESMYGHFVSHVDLNLKLYSGLISLPPKCLFMEKVAEVLFEQPLLQGHDGRNDMSEQGVIAAAFEKLHPEPIPLYEFPFCRAYQNDIDFGVKGDQGRVWGYHFSYAFRQLNAHFDRLIARKVIFSSPEASLLDRFQWLGNFGQWGVPGSTMPNGCAQIIIDRAEAFAGKSVLEIGTSRGRITAMLATLGCRVTTVDHQDRGASINLQGLSVQVIQDDVADYLTTKSDSFDLIVCDLHGNSPADWQRFAAPLMARLNGGGTLLLNNAALCELPEWIDETGVPWFLAQLPSDWKVEIPAAPPPGVAIVTRPCEAEAVLPTHPAILDTPIGIGNRTPKLLETAGSSPRVLIAIGVVSRQR